MQFNAMFTLYSWNEYNDFSTIPQFTISQFQSNKDLRIFPCVCLPSLLLYVLLAFSLIEKSLIWFCASNFYPSFPEPIPVRLISSPPERFLSRFTMTSTFLSPTIDIPLTFSLTFQQHLAKCSCFHL